MAGRSGNWGNCLKSIRESYADAVHATNLKTTAERRGSPDYLIASAWTPSRMGSLLRRLQAEWDGSAKKPDMSETDYVLMVMSLKTLGEAIHSAEVWAVKKGIESPGESARRAVNHWLDSTCRRCHGRGQALVKDAARPTLGEQCRHCGGSGRRRDPHGAGPVLDMFAMCLALDKKKMQKTLANFHD